MGALFVLVSGRSASRSCLSSVDHQLSTPTEGPDSPRDLRSEGEEKGRSMHHGVSRRQWTHLTCHSNIAFVGHVFLQHMLGLKHAIPQLHLPVGGPPGVGPHLKLSVDLVAATVTIAASLEKPGMAESLEFPNSQKVAEGFVATRPKVAPCELRSCSEVAEKLPNSCRTVALGAEMWLEFGPSCRCRSKLGRFGQFGPTSTEQWPKLTADLGHILLNVGQPRPTLTLGLRFGL